MKSLFSRYGIPDKCISDNGPQFSSKEFVEFAKSYGFIHITSSPHYPQGNGQAERTVKTVKNLLRKTKDPYKAIMDYRNTNIEEIGLSPAQMFLGRRLKTELPTTAPLLSSTTSLDDIKSRMRTRKATQKLNFDRHAGKELKPLATGDQIIMKHGKDWIPGHVMQEHSRRSYVVQSQDGAKYRRNRKHLKPTSASFSNYSSNGTAIQNDPISVVRNPPSTKSQESSPTQESVVQHSSPMKKSDIHPNQFAQSPKSSVTTTRCGRAVVPPRKFEDFTK